MSTPAWMRWTLFLAGIYNLVWGTAVILFPDSTFQVGGLYTAAHVGVDPGLYRHLWQCIGMIVGVYGIGYAIAGTDPARHWPIVLVGFLGKIFGPIGAIDGIVRGVLPASILWTNLTNDLIWLVPFALILLHAYRVSLHNANQPPPEGFNKAVDEAKSNTGVSLRDLSAAPLLVVFLRHFG
jgi:hypothetical protein